MEQDKEAGELMLEFIQSVDEIIQQIPEVVEVNLEGLHSARAPTPEDSFSD